MPTVDTLDPATFEVPSNQALLYSEVSGSETLYKYKLSSGTTGTVTTAIIAALGVKLTELPALVYQADLLACLNETFASVADLTIATSTKASTEFVKKVAATKVSKSEYLTRMAQTPTISDMETSLSAKADQSDMESALGGKADKTNVYTKQETNEAISDAIAGKTAVADGTTISGNGTDTNPLTLASDVQTQLSGLETAKHTHSNATVLAKLSEDANGKPLYDGVEIGTGSGVIDAITVNGETVTVTNKVAAITIDAAPSSHTHTFSDVTGLSDLDAAVTILEGKAHEHVLDGANYDYKGLVSVAGTTSAYTSFTEIGLSDDIAADITAIKAFTIAYTITGNDKLIYIKSNGFAGEFENITGSLTNITDTAVSQAGVIVALADGNVYVRAASTMSAANLTANNVAGGKLLGDSDFTISKTEWKQVTTNKTFVKLNAHVDHFVALDNNGCIYTAGMQKNQMQANNVSDATVAATNINSFTEVVVNDGGNKITNWIDIQAGRSFTVAVRGTISDGVQAGTIYVWGDQIDGCVGDGVSWLHDTEEKFYRAYSDGSATVFIIVASATDDASVTAGTEVYSFANNHVELVGTVVANSDGTAINVNGTTYNRASGSDVNGALIGTSTPTPLAVPTLSYAYTNGTTIVYASTDTPAKYTPVYSNGALSSQLGTASSGGYGFLVYGGSTYNRTRYNDVVRSSTVYNDWFKVSAGYYHSGALRKNGSVTEIYLWGSNEYGQLGTGYYTGVSMTSSKLTGSEALNVELVSRPMKLPTSLFPYTDVVDIKCTHYGTFLIRENGQVYFAGCNKRNYLGTGVLSDETAFIPKFVALSTRFTGNEIYAETYGSLILHNLPSLSENADDVVKSVFRNPLTTEKLDAAVAATHNHSIDVGLIDAVAIGAAQYMDVLPAVIEDSHTHSNQSSLNAISVEGNLLKINGVPYSTGGGGGGSGVVVDESNIALDTLGDIAGLSNLAGGFGLEVISCNNNCTPILLTEENIGQYVGKKYPMSSTSSGTYSDTEISAESHVGKYIKDGAIIQVAPVGAVHNAFGRYVNLYNSSKTAIGILSAENQSKGLYGVPTGGTAGYINCTKDLVTMIEAVVKKGSGNLVLYYVDPAKVASPTTATVYQTIPYSTLAGYGTLYWQIETGTVVRPTSADTYYTTDKLESVGLGDYSNEETAFFNVYFSNKTLAISEDDFDENTYYFEDGTEITSVGQIVVPYDVVDDEDVFHDVYDNDSATGTPVITGAQVKAGLYMKDGTNYVKVRSFMIPEKFDKGLFTGTIYIHPGLSNFSGMVNQVYTYSSVENTGIGFVTETVSNETTIKKVIIKLDTAVTDGSTTSTSAFKPEPGSLNNPMFAAIYSANRWSTSSVSGEYNTAVGLNSSAGGNQNTVFGDFSEAKGLVNFVAGDMSFIQGCYNVVLGCQSNAYGNNNLVAGTQNIAIGDSNLTHGYYGLTVGSGNELFGIGNIAIGSKNAIYTSMEGSVAIGKQNVVREKAKGSVTIGKELDTSAEGATVIGQKGALERFEGNFPGDDSNTTVAIQAASVNAWKTLGYDEVWESTKEGMFFGAGLKKNRTLTSVFPLAFYKYRVRPNIAGYFEKATTTSARGSADPYIFEPFMQWALTGVTRMFFTDPVQNQNDATDFTFTRRDGGRIKTFDPGIVFADNGSVQLVEFDFDHGTRWKLAADGNFKPLPYNFVDGAEAYIVVYHGASVDWTAFTNNPNDDEGANSFSSLVWKADTPYMLTGDTEFKSGKTYYTKNGDTYTEATVDIGDPVTAFTYYVKEVDATSYTTGFALVKLVIVDNVCCAEVVANTLA